MIREAMQFANLVFWPNFGLICFMAVFLGAFLWVYGAHTASDYDDIAHLPLREEE